MTPAETLAAARANGVGPYVPAQVEWLKGWCGPVVASVDLYGDVLHAVQLRTGEMLGLHEIHFRHGGVVMDADVPVSAIRLDLRRPEVRDLLVRCGALAWARDIPVALWVWATTGRVPTMLGRPHGSYRYAAIGNVLSAYRCAPPTHGWDVFVGGKFTEGPETGPEGMACADVAALRAGCVLEESDGWLVPTPDGGIGFWPKS